MRNSRRREELIVIRCDGEREENTIKTPNDWKYGMEIGFLVPNPKSSETKKNEMCNISKKFWKTKVEV